MTDLPALPLRIGFDRWRIVRSALVLLALATAVAAIFTYVNRVHPSALGEILGGRRLGPVPLIFAVVEAVALLIVIASVASAWRHRDYLVLREDGLEFHDYRGVFLVAWDNIARLERAPAGYVGLKLRDLSRLLETHQGTPEERERLATLEPYPDYDLILHPEQLSCGADRFVHWANELRAPVRPGENPRT